MADELAPNEPYFNGIIYNSNFFSNDKSVTSSYVNNTFLAKIGNPTSIAGITTFTGDVIANNTVVVGNLGVGTTTPSYKLDVSGLIHTNANILCDDRLYTNKLSVGTTSPIYDIELLTSFFTALRIGSLTSNFIIVPNFNGDGIWLDIPVTGGPSGIGSGGEGNNCWLGYTHVNGQWFYNALAGDICYRNEGGRLMFGCTAENSQMMIQNYGGLPGGLGYITIGPETPCALCINKYPPEYPLDVSGDIQCSNLILPNNGVIKTKTSTGAIITTFIPCFTNNITYLLYAPQGLAIQNNTGSIPMYFNSTGNRVGVNTVNPVTELDVSGNINTNGNVTLITDGSRSVYFKNASAIIGRLFGTTASMYFDFYTSMTFRYCNNTTNTITNATLFILNSTGATLNGSLQYTYTSIPTLAQGNIGYNLRGEYAPLPLSPASSSNYIITFTNIPPGYYLVQGYIFGTFAHTASTTIKFGLSSSSTALNTSYNYFQDIVPYSGQPYVRSIDYTYYLTNNTTTTYYMLLQTGVNYGSTSLNQFNANFVRIG